MTKLDVPVVLFTFKRVDKTLEVLERIALTKPLKLYILSDYGRNEEEIDRVNTLRLKIEQRVNWDCELIKKYASKNIGVYENIGMGAKWVLEREKYAIFLEDDNLPELSFFSFCKEMLEKYYDDTRVLWICGTNYLKQYTPEDGSSYVFTKHMLPCGWASWGHKFNKFYDGNLELLQDKNLRERVRFENQDRALLMQDLDNWNRELRYIKKGEQPTSWDYQMSFSMRIHGLYAIVPKFNQITNIGVDIDSIHGGNTYDYIMTRRFCGLPTKELDFPLKHPKVVLSDLLFEKLTGKIITRPLTERVKSNIGLLIKKILNLDIDKKLMYQLNQKFGKNKKNSKT